MMIKNFSRTVPVGIVLLLMAAVPTLSTAAEEVVAPPIAVVEQAAASLQQKLEGRQEYFAKNRAELYQLINEIMLPKFDVRYAGKLVLGKTHWLAATEEQRNRFIEVFYSFLVRTYAKGVLEFDQSKLTISPKPSYSKDGAKAMVRTEFAVEGGDNVQVNYAVRRIEEGWKIYDVRVDGVSYIQNYRSQFDAEITAQGIEAVIVRLEQEIMKAEKEGKSDQPQAI
jgi:phospholipid transport system substrate-binding protein